METRTRARLIRKATPNCLEQLFEMQNRLCDLCGHPIQDLCLAAVEHSVPVIRFARSPMNIDRATRECNSLTNLRCAHASCNHAKNGLTRDEWFARGLDNRDAPRFLTAGQLADLRFRLGQGGRTAMERQCGVFGRTKEQHRRDSQKAGRKNVATGHIQKLGRLYGSRPELRPVKVANGRKAGRLMKEQKKGIFGRTPEQHTRDSKKAGRKSRDLKLGIFAPGSDACKRGGQTQGPIQGRRNVENGSLARLRTREHQIAAGRAGGRVVGRMMKEQGRGVFSVTREQHQEIARRSAHGYWHVRRGISNPKCALCVAAKVAQ